MFRAKGTLLDNGGIVIDKFEDSKFKQDIINTSGIQALESRAKLKQFALNAPDKYTAERSKVYVATLTAMVQDSYETIWLLLKEGKYPINGVEHEEIQVNGKRWAPRLSDAEISQYANGYAMSIKEAFEKIFSVVMPDDFKDLAEDKLRQVGKLQGAMKVEAPANGGAGGVVQQVVGGGGQ
jgi:hypothetical protein